MFTLVDSYEKSPPNVLGTYITYLNPSSARGGYFVILNKRPLPGDPVTSNTSAKFNPYIHGARGLFCLIVFVFHVINSGLPTFDFLSTGLTRHALETGKFGVELFFGISGIVILPSLHRAPSILVFILDRYARILPVLWATIIAITIT